MAARLSNQAVRGGGATTLVAPFTRVNGPLDDPFTASIAGSFEGWSAFNLGAIADDVPFSVFRAGFNANADATTYLDTLYVTRKVRQPAPNDASASASTYALSDYVYADDSLVGATNSSSLHSPKPAARIVTLDRGVLGNAIGGSSWPVEIVAGHRDARLGREVACVVYKITDGTTVITVKVSAPTLSTNPHDQTSVTVFALPETDISSLADGLITLDAEVYPWVGVAASVRKTTDSTNDYEFTSQYWRKNPTLAASPPIAYVDPAAADDLTGVVSTTEATAAASPFKTIKGAADAADTSLGGTANGIDGLIIKLLDGTHVPASWGASRRQKIARVTITRAPTSTSRAAVIISPGAAVWSPNLTGSLVSPLARGALHFKDVQITRAGVQSICNGGSWLDLENVGFSPGAQTNNNLIGSSVMLRINGMTPTGATGTNQRWGPQTNPRMVLIRGYNGELFCPLERICLVGNALDKPTGINMQPAAVTLPENHVVAYNKVYRINTNILAGNESNADVKDYFWSYNQFEWITTTSGHALSVSNDGMSYSNDHVIQHHNTYVGWNVMGRENLHYDEGATPRLSRLASYYGNIHVAAFTKGDRFRYTNEANPEGFTSGSPSTRLGNWAFLYGVGCNYNFSQFTTNGPLVSDNQAQVYQGRGSDIGVTWNNASQTTRLDPLFVDNKGTKSIFEATGAGSATTANAGLGFGDYRLQSGSPAKSKVLAPIRPYTLDGVAVGSADHMGAMSAQ
jgi:hypothetical protein